MEPSPRHRVVIVAGGFGGQFAARALGGSAQGTHVDRTPHHLFQPLPYQVATGNLSRALPARRPLLLPDEPTAHLDAAAPSAAAESGRAVP